MTKKKPKAHSVIITQALKVLRSFPVTPGAHQ